jgi:hypothetical protein
VNAVSTRLGKRYTNEAADRLIGIRYPLPRRGFVALVDYMGGDESILHLARADATNGSLSQAVAGERIAELIKTRQPLFKEIMMVLHIGTPQISGVDSNILKDSMKFSKSNEDAVFELHWKTTFHNLIHILPAKFESQRSESRDFANAVGNIAKIVAPHSYTAFEKHIMGSMVVTAPEQKVINMLLRGESLVEAMALAGFKEPARYDGPLGVAEFELLSKLRKVLDLPNGNGSILQDVEAALLVRGKKIEDA